MVESAPKPVEQLVGTPSILGERIEIFSANPLPHFDQPHAKAYAARSLGEQRSTSYALICNGNLPVRSDSFSGFLACDNVSLARFRDQGLVEWPLTGSREQAVVFNRPQGQRLDTLYTTQQHPVDDDRMVNGFIRPMVELLSDLAARGVMHGSIHLGNMYMNPTTGLIQIGEALSCPPSFSLPALYCTTERAQCHPAGRGTPASSDDIYALGIVGLILALGDNPWKRANDADLLRLKITKGSFVGLLGEHRIKGSYVELFRGMLDDNQRRRWTLDDLHTWLAGRRPQQRQEDTAKANRALEIGGKGYDTMRGVAYGLAQEPADGAQLLEKGEVERWVNNSLSNEELAGTLQKMVMGMNVGGRFSTQGDMLVARAAIMLDPSGPIRYRGANAMPNGLAYLMGTLLSRGESTQYAAEVIASKLPTLWIDEQQEGRANHLHTLQQLENAKTMLERRQLGFGPERVAYQLLPALPCLSPQVKNRSCRTAHDVLLELDRAGGGEPADRHIVAFLLAREKGIPMPVAHALAAAGDGSVQYVAALLRIYGEAQRRGGPEKLPGLCARMAGMLEPATRRFFEKAAQDAAKRDLSEAAKTGILASLVEVVDSGDKLNRDRGEFESARMLYTRCTQDIVDLEADIKGRELIELNVGRPIASGIAALVGFGALILVVLGSIMGVGI